MEFMELGALNTYIMKTRDMNWADRCQLMLDISEGMTFLHSKTNADGSLKAVVYHQDLKSGNVLLSFVEEASW